MNKFESNLSRDTALTGSLVAIAIVWVVFAAVRGPVGIERNPTAPETAAAYAQSTREISAIPHAAAQPVEAKRAAVSKAS